MCRSTHYSGEPFFFFTRFAHEHEQNLRDDHCASLSRWRRANGMEQTSQGLASRPITAYPPLQGDNLFYTQPYRSRSLSLPDVRATGTASP